MRNYYTQGFDLTKWVPIKEIGGRVVVEGILPSDYKQVVSTDMINEVKHCKVWRVVAVSAGVESIQAGAHVVVLKAAIDGVDPDTPKLGIVDTEDVCAVIDQSIEKIIDSHDDDYDDPMDGDAQSALASAGFGTDEDYGSAEDTL